MDITSGSARNLLAFAWLAAAAGGVMAQGTYPLKPIRWIIPAPPGGPADVVSRTVGQKLGEIFEQQVVIDNRPGAAGQLGLGLAAKAAPDGYTIVMGNAAFAIHESLYSKLPYDAARDFAPLSQLPSSPLLLVAHPSLPVKMPKELVALAKSKPGQITYASSGSGSPHHLGVELLSSMAGIKMVHVPYKGAAPAVTDLLGGQVSLGIVALSASLPHVKTGKLTALGVTLPKRTVFAPDIPTVAEQGFPGFAVEFWMGALAPAATPREIVTRLNAEMVRVLQMPDVKERFLSQGFEVYSSAPQQFDAYIKAEIQKWANVVKESGAKAD